MATYTSAGATLLATAWQSNGAKVAPIYAALGTGCGTLASALSSGTPYTALSLAAGLPAALSVGQSLTLIDAGGDTQVVSVAAPGAALGATSIPVASFTPSATFAIGSGVAPTPSATDIMLFNELTRVAAPAATAGASAGESLARVYFDPSAPSATYAELAYYAGTATSALGSGTLLARTVIFWTHAQNADSMTYTLDTTLSLT